MYIKADLREFDLTTLGEFDVIVIDPPWKEYADRIKDFPVKTEKKETWQFGDIAKINIPTIASAKCFLFLWCGVENLENGRELLKIWGFKRCEDISWLKTNKKGKQIPVKDGNIFKRVCEHCLVGFRGKYIVKIT